MTTKTRIITLTNRAPVSIVEADWPIIAVGKDDSYGSIDPCCHQQALSQGQLDEYSLRVRMHADGRVIVYGVLSSAEAWTGTEDWRGGELLDTSDDIAAAIRRVGEPRIPDSVIRECIADLPAVEL